MKIAQIITPRRLAGAERHVLALSRALIARGHEVTLLCPTNAPWLLEAAAQAQVPACEMRIGARDPGAMWRIARFVRRHQIELIATHLRKAAHWGGWAGKFCGVPVVSTVHAPREAGHPLGRARRLIAVSQSVKTALAEQGIAPTRIDVVYNGIDIARFIDTARFSENSSRGADNKMRIGLPADCLVVGIAAHLSAHKGHAWAMEALAPLCHQNPRIRFLLVGDGPERAALEAQAQTLNLASQLVFAGFQTDVVPWMAAMDVLLLPALKAEGFGLVLAEAGALGVPIIASDDGGAAEVVEPGETGFLVAPGDVSALREAIATILGDADLRDRMGRAGRKRVLRLFSEETMVDGTLRVYQMALGQKSTH